MHIRCPHCHQPVELVENAPLERIDCPSCGSQFNLIGEETIDRRTDVGRTIGHFELVEQLGMGQFGAVWKARDTELDRTVAVKIPRQEQLSRGDVEMFLREARAAAQLRHPNIVGVHEVGRERDTVYIVSELVQGITLADRLSFGRLSPREAAELCATIADALQHAHEAGVIHRDLKPSNIMLDADGRPHLMDFGLAKRESGEITMTIEGRILGTPAYMSPEQARGEAHHADARSDVYSLGTILFELLTGELPFRGNKRMLLMQIIHDEPPSPRKLDAGAPRDLETICLRCLEKSPDRRYATARQVGDELRRYLAGEPIHARPISRVERSWRWCRRNPMVAAALAAVIASLFCGATGVGFFAVRAARNAEIAEGHRAVAETNATAARRSAADAKKLFVEAQQARRDMEPLVFVAQENLARAAADRATALRTMSTSDRQRQALAGISSALKLRPAMRELAAQIDSQTQRAGGRNPDSMLPGEKAIDRNEKLWQELLPRLSDEALFWQSEASLRRIASYEFSAPNSPGQPPLAGNNIDSLEFAPDGARVARVMHNKAQRAMEVQMSDAAIGAIVWTAALFLQAQPVKESAPSTVLLALAFTADGGQVLAVRRQERFEPKLGTVSYLLFEAFEANSGKRLRERSVPLSMGRVGLPSLKVAFRPDGRFAIVSPGQALGSPRSGPGDKWAVIDLEDGKQLWTERSATIRPVGFTPNGQQVISCHVNGDDEPPVNLAGGVQGAPRRVDFRDVETGAVVKQVDLPHPMVMSAQSVYPWISPDGKWLAGWVNFNGYQVEIIDMDSSCLQAGVPIQGQQRFAGPGTFTKDSRFLIIALRNSLNFISVPDGAVIHSEPISLLGPEPNRFQRNTQGVMEPHLSRLRLFGDGTRLALSALIPVGDQNKRPMSQKEVVEIWDLALPSFNVDTHVTHAGLLTSACMDEPRQRLYIGGDRNCGVSALDSHWRRPAVLSWSPEASPGKSQLPQTDQEGLLWCARPRGGRTDEYQHDKYDRWYESVRDDPACGFDASGRVFLANGLLFDTVLKRFQTFVPECTFSGDRRRAVFYADGAAHVLDLTEQHELARFDGPQWRHGAAVSPRANYLLAPGGAALHIACVAEGTMAGVALTANGFFGFAPHPPAFSGDEASVMITSQSRRILIDLAMRRELAAIDVPDDQQTGKPAVTGDLRRVAFFRADKGPNAGRPPLTLHLWNQGDAAPAPLGAAWRFAYDPLLARTDAPNYRIIDLTTGDEQLQVEGAPLDSTSYKSAAAGDPRVVQDKGELVIWRMADKRQVRLPRDAGFFVTFSPDGRQLVTNVPGADAAIRLWSTETGEPRAAIEPFAHSHLAGRGGNRVKHAWFAGNGRNLAVMISGQIRLIDLESRKVYAGLPRLGPRGMVTRITLTHDGNLLAAGGEDGTVELRSSVTGAFRGLLDGIGAPVTSVDFVNSAQRLVTLDASGALVMWELANMERDETRTIEARILWRITVGLASTLAVSADGSQIAAIAEDGAPALYSSDNGRLLRRFAAAGSTVVALQPRGHLLAAAGTDGIVRLFDVASGDHLAEWAAERGEITAMTFDPCGRLLATAGRNVKLWRVVDQRRLVAFGTRQEKVRELRFTRDGKRLLVTHSNTAGSESRFDIVDLAQINQGLAELGFEPADLPAR